jgi:hypothetical protein
MMIKKPTVFVLAAVLLSCLEITAFAQKPKAAPPYTISNINIVPFEEQTGKFGSPYEAQPSEMLNALSTSLFVTIEISGQEGSFQAGRKVQITVTEGKRIKYAKTEQVGLIGDGKYFVPVWLYSPMCDKVTITARLLGQTTASSMKSSVPFVCGE